LLNRLSTSRGFPCCVRFPGVHAVATTPAQRLGASSAHFPSRISLPEKGDSVGPRIGIFEDCSAFIHITACTLVGSPKVIRCIEGFSHFVTSMTAPTTSGWSIFAGWALHPLESAAFSRRTPTPAGSQCPLCGISLRSLHSLGLTFRITQRRCSGLSKRIVVARHMITNELSDNAYVCITNFISSNRESLAFQPV
jgi:hypothetical protein